MKLFKSNLDSSESVEVQSFQDVLNILNDHWQINGHSGLNPITIKISSFSDKETTEEVWFSIIGDFCGDTGILGYINFWDANYVDFNSYSDDFLSTMLKLFPKIADLNQAFDLISKRLGLDKTTVQEWRSRSIGTMTINQLHAICKMFNLKSSDILKF